MIQEIKTIGKFHPFPVYSDRQSWESLADEVKVLYLADARKLKSKNWPSMLAVQFLDFYRNGNRGRYHQRFSDRRGSLLKLLIAECIEGKGEYIDDIINGVWLICEETTWVNPAHINYVRGQSTESPKEFCDIEEGVFIDLSAAETASLLSWVYYFLSEPIGKTAPLVKRRIELEMDRRILTPYLKHIDYQWMGLNHPFPVNNWNPWINSNVLVAYLVFADVFHASKEGVFKAIRSVNRFLSFYADDGGCDEGPSYFEKAGASLLDFIEELGQVTDVSYLYGESKIRNMAAYIYKVYIGKDYYVNYADAAPSVAEPLELLRRAGNNTKDETLLGLVDHLWKNNIGDKGVYAASGSYLLYRLFVNIFSAKTEKDTGRPLKLPALSWFKGIEVLAARDKADSTEGFFFSAKGGNNAESHNHNDISNFLLYCNGNPLIVDAGVETYTKFTFNDQRYTLWTMRSPYHNTPLINGEEQLPGLEHRATEVRFESNGGLTSFSLELKSAYPEKADIESYRRLFEFKHGEWLKVTEVYSLKTAKTPLVLNFLCYEKPEIAPSEITLNGFAVMEFDNQAFTPQVEEIILKDEKILKDWRKDRLYRLLLTQNHKSTSGKAVIRFSKLQGRKP